MSVRRPLAISALTGLTLAALASPAAAGQPVNPEWHNPAYWGDGCSKVEYDYDTRTLDVAPGTMVVVKAGTMYYEYSGGFYGQTVEFPKDISFVITCPPVS